MAISASSRMRECGTDCAEAPRVGSTILFCHCAPVRPTGQLLLAQATFGDTQHGDGRFGFRSGQPESVFSEKNGGGDKRRALGAVDESAPLRLNHLTGKPVALGPKGTLWTDCAIRIINALFMRAAKDFFLYDHGLNTVDIKKLEYFVADPDVRSE